MEKVYDLLARSHSSSMHVREDPSTGVFVEGLTEVLFTLSLHWSLYSALGNAVQVCVSTCDQLLTVIAQGVKRRVCHATGSNAQSSRSVRSLVLFWYMLEQSLRTYSPNCRSHAILTIHIEQQQQTTSTSRSSDGTVEVSVKRSSITFVDLAGSERVSKTGTKVCRWT